MSTRSKIEKLRDLVKDSVTGDIVEQKVGLLVGPGENFCSVLYKVDFKVKNGPKEETYYTVAKCTPPNKVLQEVVNVNTMFKVEIAWYTTVIPTIKEFQREHSVEKVADFFPTFYGSRISLDPNSDVVDDDAVLLTENLQELGYKNIDRHIGFDLKTSKAVLRDLATFHAVPLAIKLKNPGLFEKNIKPFLPGFKSDSKQYQIFISEFKEIPEIAPYIDRVHANLDKNKANQNSPTTKEPWVAVCHNDFWINNIMVKEGDDVRTMFLDFQMPKYGPIVTDVLIYLIVSVNLKVVTEHMDELLRYYWDEFVKNLKQLGVDNNPSLTFDEFLKQIDEAARLGLWSKAIIQTFIIMADKGSTFFDSSDENYKEEDLKKFKISLNNRQVEKYKWIVLEFVKRGWI